MRLTTGHQAALDASIRNLRLVQYALTDRSVEADQAGNRNLAAFLSDESDAIRQACNTLDSIVRTASEEN